MQKRLLLCFYFIALGSFLYAMEDPSVEDINLGHFKNVLYNVKKSFIKHRCLFIKNYNSNKNKISSLLQNNAQQFNNIIETSIGMEDIKGTIKLLNQLFFMAKNNTKYPQDGTIVSIEDIDC